MCLCHDTTSMFAVHLCACTQHPLACMHMCCLISQPAMQYVSVAVAVHGSHKHTHIYVYGHMCMCVSVCLCCCVCVYLCASLHVGLLSVPLPPPQLCIASRCMRAVRCIHTCVEAAHMYVCVCVYVCMSVSLWLCVHIFLCACGCVAVCVGVGDIVNCAMPSWCVRRDACAAPIGGCK